MIPAIRRKLTDNAPLVIAGSTSHHRAPSVSFIDSSTPRASENAFLCFFIKLLIIALRAWIISVKLIRTLIAELLVALTTRHAAVQVASVEIKDRRAPWRRTVPHVRVLGHFYLILSILEHNPGIMVNRSNFVLGEHDLAFLNQAHDDLLPLVQFLDEMVIDAVFAEFMPTSLPRDHLLLVVVVVADHALSLRFHSWRLHNRHREFYDCLIDDIFTISEILRELRPDDLGFCPLLILPC